MRDDIELLVEETSTEDTPGVRVSGPTLVSLVLHALFIIFIIQAYHPISSNDKAAPIAHYIELIKQSPRDFTEAPGQKREKASVNALWSDANRHAATPTPTGDKPTMRPGDGKSTQYTPPAGADVRGSQLSVPDTTPSENREQRTENVPDDIKAPSSPAVAQANAAAAVNWHSVIKEVGKVATLGGGQNLDISKMGGEGGEKGFAEQGPLSFETQWYDWGEYAQSMVSKIRVHWYENMPPLIRTGMKGVVTIRFTL